MFQTKKYFSIYLIIVLLLFSFLLGLIIGQSKTADLKNLPWSDSPGAKREDRVGVTREIQPEKGVDFDLFWDVWNLIEEKYITKPVDESKLFQGALSGMVASLKDPYSVYLEPEIAKKFTQELAGNFEGIGAEIGIKGDRLTIIAPLAGSPAEKAGLKPGDKIYFIDDYDTTDIALDYAVSLIRGPKATSVVLTILRNGLKEPKKITITRDVIEIKSVSWEMIDKNVKCDTKGVILRPDVLVGPKDSESKVKGQMSNVNCQIAYLKISHFNEDTENDFKKAVLEILKEKPKGLILDLRNNPGGFLETAIKVASYWIEDGTIVIESRNSSDNSLPSRKDYPAQGQAFFKDLKTVVLINQGSASGSEIVAGALQDYKKATLIGEKTFGKGSVQELESLKDGSAVKITVAHWLTPKGRLIEEEGIKPDIEIKLTEKDYEADKDPQLEKAVSLINR